MSRNIGKSVGAVLVGFVSIGALGFVMDTVLQSAGVLPETGSRRFADRESMLALTYHLAFVTFGGYLTARLAPNRPFAHALALGVLGTLFSAAGLIAIITRDLAPAWYGWVLVVLAIPVTWVGAKLFTLRREYSVRQAEHH